MDPTKPILDIYGDSFYQTRQREPKPQNYKPTNLPPPYTQNNSSKYNLSNHYSKKPSYDPTYNQLQQKYQDLYQAYRDKSSKLTQIQNQSDHLKNQNSKLKEEIDRLSTKNQQLNSLLLSKNIQLEDAYRKLQDQMRGVGGGTRGRTNQTAINKLEDGLREAINSNFQILRQSALSQLKQFVN